MPKPKEDKEISRLLRKIRVNEALNKKDEKLVEELNELLSSIGCGRYEL